MTDADQTRPFASMTLLWTLAWLFQIASSPQ